MLNNIVLAISTVHARAVLPVIKVSLCLAIANYISYEQCDQIGRFLKVLGNRKSSKRSPNDWQLFGLFWKTSLLCKNCISYFLGNFWKNWATFFSNIWSHCLRTTGAQARAKMLEFGDKFIAQLMDIYFWTSLLPLQNFIMQFTDPGLSRNSFLQI